MNWSPHLNVDPQPSIEAGYYSEHNKVFVGAIHAGYKNEAILGYAYDFNERWRVQVDWQSGSENHRRSVSPATSHGISSSIPRFISVIDRIRLMGYIVFTYTFHLWATKKTSRRRDVKRPGQSKRWPEKPKSTRSRISAGLLMFRRKNDQVEVLLAHPGGPDSSAKMTAYGRFPRVNLLPEKIY